MRQDPGGAADSQARIRGPGSAPLTTSAFDLPDHLIAKADPTLIAGDEAHFPAIAESLERSIADLSERLDVERKAPGGIGQGAMDRDMEIHRLSARLRALRRFGLDLCLRHIVSAEDPAPVYIGRLGLTDSEGARLLLDWRSPAAEPFFGATHANPMGLASRRRYRWTRGRISDYWDEVFTADGFAGHAPALDDQSAFIASLGSSRSARMGDVLATIAADQDAIVRAGSRGALVVDGGPGTGKTVVALHRSAYLLYSDPRLGHHRGGVLFIGPHQPYLAYVADVLPSLGEEGVQTCTLRDLVPEGAGAAIETDLNVALLKSSADLVKAIETAVRFYEEAPTTGMTVLTHWADIWLSADDWTDAFQAPNPGAPHNEARDQIWEELVAILVGKHDGDVSADLLRRSLLQDLELLTAFNSAWPVLEATDLVGTSAQVVDDLTAVADDEYGTGLVTMLRGEDFHDALVDQTALPGTDPDLGRCCCSAARPAASQSSGTAPRPGTGFPSHGRNGSSGSGSLDRVNLATLRINYRTPEEVMAEAEPVIRAVLPDANVPTSIRSTGVPVVHGSASDLGSIIDTWLAEHAEGTACVISTGEVEARTFPATSRVRSLTPELSKGLEFDLVVLLDPEAFGDGIEGTVDRYVAMTRATQQLVILTGP